MHLGSLESTRFFRAAYASFVLPVLPESHSLLCQMCSVYPIGETNELVSYFS